MVIRAREKLVFSDLCLLGWVVEAGSLSCGFGTPAAKPQFWGSPDLDTSLGAVAFATFGSFPGAPLPKEPHSGGRAKAPVFAQAFPDVRHVYWLVPTSKSGLQLKCCRI